MRTIYCILAVSSALVSTVSSQTLHVLSIGVEPKRSFHSSNDPYARDAAHMARALGLPAHRRPGEMKSMLLRFRLPQRAVFTGWPARQDLRRGARRVCFAG